MNLSSPLSRIKPVRPVSLISTSALRLIFAASISALLAPLYLTKSLLSCCIIKAARAKSALLLMVILLVNPFIVTVCPDPSKDRTPLALSSRSESLSRSTPPQSISSMTFEDVLVNDQPLKL